MKKVLTLAMISLAIMGCNSVEKNQQIVNENYRKISDTFITDNVYYVPKIPSGIDRPDREGLYNLTIGDDTFIINRIHIIDYKNNYTKKKIKTVSYGVIEIVFPSEVITNFDTSNIINGGYIVMLDKNNTIKLIERVDGTVIRPSTKVKKVLIAPPEFVEHRLATGDTIPALK